ncbi:hypothetical protein RZS08_04950, partial [Arthrospira platensis SPKY1]|nr:hypothetical protein [Arthrospira platensis SPKY1]
LAGAVGAEIEEKDHVARADAAERGAFAVGEADRLQEFVGDAAGVAVADGPHGVVGRLALAAGQQVPGQAGAFPAPVPVHGIVTPKQAGDANLRSGPKFLLQLADETGPGFR